MLADIAKEWSSFSKVDADLEDCKSIENTIVYLFKLLEKKHGKILFSSCIFYITIFENGISERELEDILSIDDVLTEVFKYHQPSIRRFPFALWIRIKQDLKEYFVTKNIYGIPVITW